MLELVILRVGIRKGTVPRGYQWNVAMRALEGYLTASEILTRKILKTQVFFQAMVSDVEMVLGKSVMELGHRYAELAPAGTERVYPQITEEFERAERCILELKQLDRLLDDQPVLQRNIRLRNPYVAPLHLLQIDLLGRWRESGREDDHLLEPLRATVKGIALGIQNTGRSANDQLLLMQCGLFSSAILCLCLNMLQPRLP